MNNIINKWKYSSLKFTKYNAIENKINKFNENILWEFYIPIIYASNKKFL